jgi:glycosyltransferase involved in cell wall biosynthesis
MRILFLSHLYPWPLNNGTHQRIYHLVEGLARRHRVTLVVPAPDPAPATPLPLGEVCERVVDVDAGPAVNPDVPSPWSPAAHRLASLFASPWPNLVRRAYRPRLAQALAELRRAETWDAVWVERMHVAEAAREAGFGRFVLDVDTLESVDTYRRLRNAPRYLSKWLHYAECAKLYLYERLLARRAAGLVVCKDEDHAFWGRHSRKVFTVVNGVAEAPPCDPALERPDELLFVGTLCYEPNIDALRFFLGSVWPELRRRRPGVRLSVVGREPTPVAAALHDGESVFVHADVPDLAPYYERAAVVIAPIRQGGGTRLKVLEALMKGKALVATAVGAEGLDLRPGTDLELADTPEAIVAACDRLLGDPAGRRRLGARGRERVRECYGWRRAVDQAEAALFASRSNGRPPDAPAHAGAGTRAELVRK